MTARPRALRPSADEGGVTTPAVHLGPYVLDEIVGRGSSGVVYRAFDELSGDPVAVKLLDGFTADDPSAVTRFARECELVGCFEHPGLVSLRASGKTEHGVSYLVMDLALGESLKDRLARGRMSNPESMVIALCEAAAAMHRAGWVHRDIKPANVVLEAAGPRLLDFGLAARAGTEERLTRTGYFVGTPLYLAPEQILGAPPAPTMDVYALSALLFEAVCGHPPFQGPIEAVLTAKSQSDPPVLACPAHLSALLAAGLSRDPAARPPDGAALAAALRATMTSEPVTMVPVTMVPAASPAPAPRLDPPPPRPRAPPQKPRLDAAIEAALAAHAPPPPSLPPAPPVAEGILLAGVVVAAGAATAAVEGMRHLLF